MKTKLQILLALFLLPLLIGRLAPAVFDAVAPYYFPAQPAQFGFSTNRIEGTFSNLFIMRGSAGDFAARANDGINLLRAAHVDKLRIAELDFVDIFPVLLNSPWPDGWPVWLDNGNTFDLSNHLDPKTMFKGAQVLMVPKQVSTPACYQTLMQVYGPYISTNYQMVAESPGWVLCVKK
jgi:hypothetical protein